MVLHGLPVLGLMRSHRWGPAWLLRSSAAEVIPEALGVALPLWSRERESWRDGAVRSLAGDVDEAPEMEPEWPCCDLWPSRLCFCSLAGVSKRREQP